MRLLSEAPQISLVVLCLMYLNILTLAPEHSSSRIDMRDQWFFVESLKLTSMAYSSPNAGGLNLWDGSRRMGVIRTTIVIQTLASQSTQFSFSSRVPPFQSIPMPFRAQSCLDCVWVVFPAKSPCATPLLKRGKGDERAGVILYFFANNERGRALRA